VEEVHDGVALPGRRVAIRQHDEGAELAAERGGRHDDVGHGARLPPCRCRRDECRDEDGAEEEEDDEASE
jgi:hypothetical protein